MVAAPLDQIARAGECRPEHHAKHEMPGDARGRRLRGPAWARRNEMRGDRIDRPGGDDEGGERPRNRERAGGGISAPGDRNGSHRQDRKDRRRHGGMVLRRHDEGGHSEIDGERARRHGIDPAGGRGRPEPQAGDDQERGEDEARHCVEEMRRRSAGLRDIGQRPEQAEGERRDREPSPQPQAGERERGRGDDREIEVERPVFGFVRLDKERRHLGADETERRQRRPVQHGGGEGDERHDAEHQERGPRREKSVERIGGPYRRKRNRGAGCGENARDVRDCRHRICSRLAASQPLAASRESRREKPAECDAHAGPDPALLDRIAHQEDAAEREREAADPDHPAGAEPFLETGPLRRRRGWRRR